eukprot:COSAG03_NODE_1858_length_3423_cov_7.658544_3_plen_94_part_00
MLSLLALLLLLAPPVSSRTNPYCAKDPDRCELAPWFNCTAGTPLLRVVFGKPVGAIDCGTRIFKCPEGPTQQEPLVTFAGADPAAGYTVMMIE